jgi:glucose-1-phosphate adenylyltransferase
MARTRAVILAGGEGSRLGILTSKRTKPAVPFAGKYRIIDFTLSNCVNSGIFDVMLLAQYRPHSLIEHIGAGGPWDLNRDFTGGIRIYSPYKGRGASDWYMGTADAVQQNFRFVKQGDPDLILILSGDHIYTMNYEKLIQFHREHNAAMTMATIKVPLAEASRFGVVGVDDNNRVRSFIEKPQSPPSNLINMGVYLFNLNTLNEALWVDHLNENSSHDFGKDVLPWLVSQEKEVFAFPYDGYWVDVGTLESYWKTHMDLLKNPPPIDLRDRKWVVHTRTEERPPVRIQQGAEIIDSMIADGCVLASGSRVERCFLAPGVSIGEGAKIFESIILTDTSIGKGAIIHHSIFDKRIVIGENAHIGGLVDQEHPIITTIGKNSILPPEITVEPGAIIGTDVVTTDFPSLHVREDEFIQTKRLPHEI